MIIEILIALLLGVSAGTFTGLTPGIHINLVGVGLVGLSTSFLSWIHPIYFVVFIVSMAITHTFVDFIPSMFLGCPDTDTELSILPGHELLMEGKGYEAVALTAYGGIAAIIILAIMFIPSILIIEKTYGLIKIFIPYLLIFITLSLIFFERKKIYALLAIILTGILGWIIFNFPNLNQPLLPLLSGLFGSSSILISIKNKQKIPEQIITNPKINLRRPLIGAIIASPLCSFLPALGSGQAAIIGNFFSSRNSDRKEFLVLIGAINTLIMGLSFITFYAISKTRTGASAAIKEIIGSLSLKILILILAVSIISGVFSFFLTIFLAKFFSKKIYQINYLKLSLFALFILLIVVFLVSGIIGISILVISTITGIYCINLGVRRTNMMGCLIIPTIIYYLFLL